MNEKLKNAWTINALLAVIAVILAAVYLHTPAQDAHAAGGGWDTDGIMALSADSDNQRVVIIDTKKQNINIYKSQNNRFRLVGARSYKYDVEIEDSATINVGNGLTYAAVYNAWQKREAGTK